MMDVGLIVSPRSTDGLRSVSAMLPDETEHQAFVNTKSGLGVHEFVSELERKYQKPNGYFKGLAKHIIDRGDIADSIASGKAVEKFTLTELTEQYPKLAPTIIDGLIREGETANFISVPKVGKSWGVYGLGISIVMGWDWLDTFPVAQGRVLLVDNELSRETISYRIPKVGAAMAEARGEFLSANEYGDNFHVWPLRGKLRTLEELGAEFDKIEPGYYKLILLDAKYRFALAGVSENDNAAETLVYNTLDKYAAKLKAAILLVHHSSKGGQSDKRVTDVGSGAGAQSRAADCHMVLREHENEGLVVLDAAVRSFAPVKPMVLKWEFPLWIPTDADPLELKGKKSKQDERQEKNDREGRLAIASVLNDGSTTASQLRKATGFGAQRIDRLVGMMIRDNEITVKLTTANGNECDEYSLTEHIE